MNNNAMLWLPKKTTFDLEIEKKNLTKKLNHWLKMQNHSKSIF